MPDNCAIVSCKNWQRSKTTTKDSSIFYHRFPKDDGLRKTRIMRCRKDTFNVESARVCSEHFEDSCFIRDLQNELLVTSYIAGRRASNETFIVQVVTRKVAKSRTTCREAKSTRFIERHAKADSDRQLYQYTAGHLY